LRIEDERSDSKHADIEGESQATMQCKVDEEGILLPLAANWRRKEETSKGSTRCSWGIALKAQAGRRGGHRRLKNASVGCMEAGWRQRGDSRETGPDWERRRMVDGSWIASPVGGHVA